MEKEYLIREAKAIHPPVETGGLLAKR